MEHQEIARAFWKKEIKELSLKVNLFRCHNKLSSIHNMSLIQVIVEMQGFIPLKIPTLDKF